MAQFSKISEEDVFHVYRAAYSIPIPWDEVLDEELAVWMENYEMATNCSRSLIMPSLLSLTATLCGPLSSVTAQDHDFNTSLNQFLIAVCDPGGGKSNTFNRCIQPTLSELQTNHDLDIQLENYTTAGIQVHQNKNRGYGLITGDEGHRFLTSINYKQSKGEAERSLLCKLWGGKGDHNVLSTGTRGFERTSLSTCVLIQPQPFISELISLNGDDGLIDRFLVFAAKPVFNATNTVRENLPKISSSNMQSFEDTFMKIYESHKDGIQYTLSEEAHILFDEMVDSYSEFIRNKYDQLQEQDQEKDDIIDPSQAEATPINPSSKDTTHILRLAVPLHILQHYFRNKLQGNESTDAPLEIPVSRVRQAKILYNVLAQQKNTFMQCTFTAPKYKLNIRTIRTFHERVVRCVTRLPGPAVPMRLIQKHIKNSLIDNIKLELEQMERNGFGSIKTLYNGKKTRHIFFKLHPSCIDTEVAHHMDIIKLASISIQEYKKVYENLSQLDSNLRNVIVNHHPQAELIQM